MRLPSKQTVLFATCLVAGCTGRAANAPPRVPVSVARVERRPVPFEIAASGTVEPLRSVDILPQVTGTILKVRFAEGDEVSAGQILFEIDPRPYAAVVQQATANLLRDQAQSDNAARDAERYRDLATNNTVTKEDYQQKQATADALAATVRADSAALSVARLNLEYATIRAPISGRTGRLLLHEGNVVRPTGSDPLVTINQLRPILVRFSVPAAQLPELRRRAGRALQTLANPARDSGTPAEGVLSFLDNQVDTTTGTVLLKARFPNRDGTLWPGEFVEVTLIVDVQADALVVPSQAVMTGQQGTYVFVVNAEGKADQRAVTVTRTIDTLSVLAPGLAPGTLVVTDGQLKLSPDSRVEIRSGPKTEPPAQQ